MTWFAMLSGASRPRSRTREERETAGREHTPITTLASLPGRLVTPVFCSDRSGHLFDVPDDGGPRRMFT